MATLCVVVFIYDVAVAYLRLVRCWSAVQTKWEEHWSSEKYYDIVAVAGFLLLSVYSQDCQLAEIYERDNASDDGDSGPAQTACFSSWALRCLAMSARPPGRSATCHSGGLLQRPWQPRRRLRPEILGARTDVTFISSDELIV